MRPQRGLPRGAEPARAAEAPAAVQLAGRLGADAARRAGDHDHAHLVLSWMSCWISSMRSCALCPAYWRSCTAPLPLDVAMIAAAAPAATAIRIRSMVKKRRI